MRHGIIDICGRSRPAVVAETFVERLIGLHRFVEPPPALIVRGSSVHGFGLRLPIWVIGVDEYGCGAGGAVLAPWRVVRFPRASAVIEIPEPPSCSRNHETHVVRWHR